MTIVLEGGEGVWGADAAERLDLIGRIGAHYLADRLAEDAGSGDAYHGTARFILDCLSAGQTAAIARAILADPALAPRFEIRLPERFVAGCDLPAAVLTAERATYFRNTVSDRPALLLANTGDDEEQSLRDITAVGAGDLQAEPGLWVHIAGGDLPIPDIHRKWWLRALSALQDLRFVPLDRYADFVLRTRELVEQEGLPIVHALGAALPALRLPRDRCYFEALPDAVRTHASRWRALFAAAHTKRACYLSKQTPSGGVLTEDDLRTAFARVRESIPGEYHDAVERFVQAPAGWTPASAELAECEWEGIKPLFDGLKRERFNLGQATLAFYDEGSPDELSDAEREYLARLSGRRTSAAELEEDQAFYTAHRDEMRQDRKLRSAWDRFIFGTPRETHDFLAGIFAALEGFPWETPARSRSLAVRVDRKHRRDLRDLNVDAGLFFAHRYRGLPAQLGRGVVFDLGELLNFDRIVEEWRTAGEGLNQTESKAALQLKFSVELEVVTEAGATEGYAAQFVWRFDPLRITCELGSDWPRLAERPLTACRISRERLSGKGKTQSLDLFDVRTLRAAYGQARGSLVPAFKPALDLASRWRRNLAEAEARALVSPGVAAELAVAFQAFEAAYSTAVREFRMLSTAAPSLEAQATAYGSLLDRVCQAVPGDRGRELLLRPLLEIGTITVDGGAPAAIVAPWHPIRLAAIRRAARRVTGLVRRLLESQEVRFADARLFFRDTLAELAQPTAPEVVLGWTNEQAHLLATTEAVGDYTLHEAPVVGREHGETNENPHDAATRVAELVERYLALHPHEQANLSVVLYNCDSAGLPVAVVGRLSALGDGEEGSRCQVVLRHRDGARLRRLYEEIVEASDADGDVLIASETTRDFMARLRIGIMADQAPPPDPRDGCPEDIVFLQDVIARHATVAWFPADAAPLAEDAVGPAYYSRRRPATRGDMRSVSYLCSPAQTGSAWAHLGAISALSRGELTADPSAHHLPARQLDFRDAATARIVEETHNLASWVANYDELLDRRQLLEQDVRVIRYKQSPAPGRNLIVSSRAPLGLLRSMLLARLGALNLGLPQGDLRTLADRFIDTANGLSGDIVLRAAKRGRSASELMGLVLSQHAISWELGRAESAWFFLDDYADWLGAREEQIADLLILTPTQGGNGQGLDVVVVESKYIEPSQLARKRKESARQLRTTVRRLSGAIGSQVPHLDRDLWLARLSDLLIDGMRLPSGSGLDLPALRRAIREGACPVSLRGYSHVFVSGPTEGPDLSACVVLEDDGAVGADMFQETFGRDLVRDLVRRFAADDDPVAVRRASGSSPWAHPGAVRPERAAPLALQPGQENAAATEPAAPMLAAPPVGEVPPAAGETGGGTERTGEAPEPVPSVAARVPATWFGDGAAPAPAPDPGASEWLRRVEVATRTALQQFQLQSKLLSASLTPNAALLKFQGSANLTVEQVLRRRTEFLTTHGLQLIGVQPEPGVVALSIARPERKVVTLAEAWQHWAPPTQGGNQSLLIGIREDDGRLLTLSPGSEHAPHTLIAGATGSGKSVLMQDIILSIAATNTPEEARITLIDPKQGVDYFAFEDLPHLDGGIIDQQEIALARIDALVEEMDRRYGRLRAAKTANLRDYNARVSAAERIPVLWLIHDEFAEWMMADTYKEEVTRAVGRLGVKARAAGIHLVFAAQRPEASVMPMQLRANLGNRLILRVDSEGTSEIALGDKGAERLLGRGHLMAKLEGGQGIVYAQVPYASPADLAAKVAQISAAAGQPRDERGKES